MFAPSVPVKAVLSGEFLVAKVAEKPRPRLKRMCVRDGGTVHWNLLFFLRL
jgi:hypothetical protein